MAKPRRMRTQTSSGSAVRSMVWGVSMAVSEPSPSLWGCMAQAPRMSSKARPNRRYSICMTLKVVFPLAQDGKDLIGLLEVATCILVSRLQDLGVAGTYILDGIELHLNCGWDHVSLLMRYSYIYINYSTF